MSDPVQFLDKLHAASTLQFPGPQPTLSRSRYNSSNLLTRSTVQCSSVHPVSFNSTNCWKCCARWSLYGEIYRYIGNIAAGKARISSNLSQIMAKQESTPVSSCSCPPGLGSCRYKPVEMIRKSRYYLQSSVSVSTWYVSTRPHTDMRLQMLSPTGSRLSAAVSV